MATKKQLNKKIELLERQSVKQEVAKHKSNYIHIPKPKGLTIGKFFLTIFLAFLSTMNFLLIKLIWNHFNLGYVFAKDSEMINYVIEGIHLIVLYPLVSQFILISLTVLSFVSLFKKLKSYDEEGLISGLIVGLIVGLISGLIFGLIFGLIRGFD